MMATGSKLPVFWEQQSPKQQARGTANMQLFLGHEATSAHNTQAGHSPVFPAPIFSSLLTQSICMSDTDHRSG